MKRGLKRNVLVEAAVAGEVVTAVVVVADAVDTAAVVVAADVAVTAVAVDAAVIAVIAATAGKTSFFWISTASAI
jgi:hypothetical protein